MSERIRFDVVTGEAATGRRKKLKNVHIKVTECLEGADMMKILSDRFTGS